MLDRIKFFWSIVDIKVGLNVSTRLKPFGVDAMHNTLTRDAEIKMAEKFREYIGMSVSVEYQKSPADKPVIYHGRLQTSAVGKSTGRWYLKIEHENPVLGSDGRRRPATNLIPSNIVNFTVDTPDLGPVHIYW